MNPRRGYAWIGSGQKLLEYYLRQLPDSYVNLSKTPVVFQFEEWIGQWFASEKERERLNAAGVHQTVLHDAIAQVLFAEIGWKRQNKVLFVRDWIIDNFFKFTARKEIYDSLVKANKTRFTSPRVFALPLGGLVRLPEISKLFYKIRKESDGAPKKMDILNPKGKSTSIGPATVKLLKESFYLNETDAAFELFPNLRFIVLVRDPRSLASSRLARSYSKESRREKFVAFVKCWVALMREITKMCDSHKLRCFYLRYEDLLERPTSTLKGILTGRTHIGAFKGVPFEFEEYPRGDDYNTTSWKEFVPPGVNDILFDDLDLLAKFGYPLDHNSPTNVIKGNPLDDIPVPTEFDLYQIYAEAAVNF